MKVIKCVPEKPEVEVIKIPNTLDSLHEQVGGYIETMMLPEGDAVCILNEEGKMIQMEISRTLYNSQTNEMVDVLCGPFLIAGVDGEEFCSLTYEQLKKYCRIFGRRSIDINDL